MRCYYDFHIHSCLSPCADMDMTPHSIAGMSYINGLNAIAVADHNTARNIRAVTAAAQQYEICVVPAIEAESAENIHLLCLFPTIEAAEEMGQVLESHLPPIKNRPDIFGEQWTMNECDEKTGEIDVLLINATDLCIEEIKAQAEKLGGVCIAAHIDREKNGIVATLGCVPEYLDFQTLELSRRAKDFEKDEKYKYITDSDAHILTDIAEKSSFLEVNEISVDEILKNLR
ncbi:MAG: phosphoesterase [Ruminococcaceae bacterium]|nr:phosphoesterase [Oscillospiraceae bacterium]